MKIGDKFGNWTLKRPLGKGGNGAVFEAQNDGCVAAIKILVASSNQKRLVRFSDEINAMKKCAHIPGVLPLLDYFIPPPTSNLAPWLVMPIATGLVESLGHRPKLDAVIDAIKGIAKVLAAMHELEISHRDIKPDNLFLHNKIWTLGDFGLADFDGKASQTKLMEKVGPLYYLAPEMLNSATKADGKPADVYSLAKTMWVLGTGQRFPLPGHQQSSTMAMTLSAYTEHPRAPLLDKLIEAATQFIPEARPTMKQFLHELEAWSTVQTNPGPGHPPSLARYKSLLEGRLAKLKEAEAAASLANQLKEREAIRIRESFRTTAISLQRLLADAGFVSPSLSIDNYYYGFEVQATLPYTPGENVYHRLKIMVHTNPTNESASHFRLYAWYYMIVTTDSSDESVLWKSEREFLTGGRDEEFQLTSMIDDLLEQLPISVEHLLEHAGLL